MTTDCAGSPMPYGLYISAEGALAQSLRLDTISNNLANVDTAGFKRDLAMFQARYAEEIERGQAEPGSGSINDLGGGVIVLETKTDYSIGPQKHTEVPTDMSIQGEGFFVVQKGNQSYLTRAGNFRLTDTGALVTQDGLPVISDEGDPVAIDPGGGAWNVSHDGVVIQQGGATIRLALTQPESLGDLVKVGENLFAPLSTPKPLEPEQRRVAQGWLEGSSVKPTREMMDMIEASRAFEANVNMIRNQDQMLGTLVNRVLRTG
jgi:flagellar basal-body rod protein FlgF